MKHVGIQQPCTEDWNRMTPNEQGAFCQKCAKQVHDFTNKSSLEIKQTLLNLKGQEICGRMTVGQERILNAEFEWWLQQNKTNFQRLFVIALLVVFGITLFSCEDERDQRKLADAQMALSRMIAPEPETPNKSDEKTNVAPVTEVVAEEIHADPAYLIDEVVNVEYELEEIEIVENTDIHDYVISGAIVSEIRYINYIENTTPIPETDENGIPYPTEYKAFAFPNPAVDRTTLQVEFPQEQESVINLYDTSGKWIREIHSGKIKRGILREDIDLNELTPGMYLLIIQSKAFRETVRIIKN